MSTENQETNTAAKQEERTFTQSEMDIIISDRLKREQAKYADYEELKIKAEKYDETEEAAKTELQKATEKANSLQSQLDQMKEAQEINKVREKVAKEHDIPAELLSGNDEEACTRQAKAILAFAKPTGYPRLRDSGEVRKMSGTKTRDLFDTWVNQNTVK